MAFDSELGYPEFPGQMEHSIRLSIGWFQGSCFNNIAQGGGFCYYVILHAILLSNISVHFHGHCVDSSLPHAIFQEAQSYADDNSLLFMETSAKTSMNVNEIFMAIGRCFSLSLSLWHQCFKYLFFFKVSCRIYLSKGSFRGSSLSAAFVSSLFVPAKRLPKSEPQAPGAGGGHGGVVLTELPSRGTAAAGNCC